MNVAISRNEVGVFRSCIISGRLPKQEQDAVEGLVNRMEACQGTKDIISGVNSSAIDGKKILAIEHIAKLKMDAGHRRIRLNANNLASTVCLRV
jgi:hypothetical protein